MRLFSGSEELRTEYSVWHWECGEDISWPNQVGKNLEKLNNLISNFRRVLNFVCFLLGNSPASKSYIPTFRNTLSVPSS